MMFFVRRVDVPRGRVLIRKDAVRFVEAVTAESIQLYVDEIGKIVTDTYDFDGFASLVMDLDVSEDAQGREA